MGLAGGGWGWQSGGWGWQSGKAGCVIKQPVGIIIESVRI